MKTITNVSRGRHQVKTLDQGLVFMDPGDVLTAEVESTYGRLMGRSLSLRVEEAAEGAEAGLVKADPQPEVETPTEQRQIDPAEAGAAPTGDDKAEWQAYAAAKGVKNINKSWGVNRLKTEIAQLESAS